MMKLLVYNYNNYLGVEDLVKLKRVTIFLIDQIKLVFISHTQLVISLHAVHKRHQLWHLKWLQLLAKLSANTSTEAPCENFKRYKCVSSVYWQAYRYKDYIVYDYLNLQFEWKNTFLF